jgi:hypothetical protein
MVSHGIPVLLLSPPGKPAETFITSHNDDAAFLLQSLLDTREPLLFFPVSAYPVKSHAERTGVRLWIGEPLSSSAAPDAGHLLEEIARRITGSAAINQKR